VSRQPLGGGGFRSRRRIAIDRSCIGRSATTALGGSATASFAAATAAAMMTTTEQTVLAAAARATTARLGGRTRRLFDGTATRRLGRTATARFFSAAAATAMATAEQLPAGVGLTFHHNRRTQQGHHTNGGSHHKILTHLKSSKKTKHKSWLEADHGLPAAHVTKSVLVTAAAYRDQTFSIY